MEFYEVLLLKAILELAREGSEAIRNIQFDTTTTTMYGVDN